MKKIIPVLFILLFIHTMSAHAEDVHQAVIDGYHWENLSEKEKILIIYGFGNGYSGGWLNGYFKGTGKTGIIDISEEEEVVVLKKTNGFYSHEVDSFLKTYPLCRRLEIADLLMGLANVWNEKAPQHTDYESIGKGCLKLNK